MSHTNEPWIWREQGDANEFCLLEESNGKWVIAFLQNGEILSGTQRENARRIVACVNACAGFKTAVLEAAASENRGVIRASQIERDELLAALKKAYQMLCEFAPHIPGYFDRIHGPQADLADIADSGVNTGFSSVPSTADIGGLGAGGVQVEEAKSALSALSPQGADIGETRMDSLCPLSPLCPQPSNEKLNNAEIF